MNRLRTGVRWNRMLTRIADKRSARRTTAPKRSLPTPLPDVWFSKDEIGMGSPAIYAGVVMAPQVPLPGHPDETIMILWIRPLSDFKIGGATHLTQIGGPTPDKASLRAVNLDPLKEETINP